MSSIYACDLAFLHLDIGSCVAVEDNSAISSSGVDGAFKMVRAFKDQIAAAQLVMYHKLISLKGNAVRGWVTWIINDVKFGLAR